jgi:hypothetical protein
MVRSPLNDNPASHGLAVWSLGRAWSFSLRNQELKMTDDSDIVHCDGAMGGWGKPAKTPLFGSRETRADATLCPDMSSLVPLWRHNEQSKTPAAKAVPVRIAV